MELDELEPAQPAPVPAAAEGVDPVSAEEEAPQSEVEEPCLDCALGDFSTPEDAQGTAVRPLPPVEASWLEGAPEVQPIRAMGVEGGDWVQLTARTQSSQTTQPQLGR